MKEKKLPCSLPSCESPPRWRVKDDQGRPVRNWCLQHYEEFKPGLEKRGWTAEAIASPETELALQARPVPEQVATLALRPKPEPTYTEHVIYENSGKPLNVQRETLPTPINPPIPEVPQLAWWQGAGELTLTPQQQEILWQDVNEDEVLIRPDGIVFLPWAKVWKVILQAFSPHVPSLIPLGKPMIQDRTICMHMVMIVHGMFGGDAIGECRYVPTNKQMSWASCVEGAVSDAIVKISKRHGMFQELWSVPWCNAWKKVHAVRVFRTQVRGEYVSPWQWRRTDDEPFYDEGDPDKSSPGQGTNAARWEEEAENHIRGIKQ